jgi:hypothetical protein
MRRELAKPFKRIGSGYWWGRTYAPTDLWARRKKLEALGIILKRETAYSLGTSSLNQAKAIIATQQGEAAQSFVWLPTYLN